MANNNTVSNTTPIVAVPISYKCMRCNRVGHCQWKKLSSFQCQWKRDWIMDCQWKKLSSFPFIKFSQPLTINNDEFVVAASKRQHIGDGIYKFNIHKKRWMKIFHYDKNFNCGTYSAAYNNKHKLLYICDTLTYPRQMLTFDLQTST
eukprot:503208_1